MPHIVMPVGQGGPLLDVVVAVSEPRREALSKAGQQVPNPIPVRALIDTGASNSAVDPVVVKQLQLSPTGKTPIVTPSTGNVPHICDTYDVHVVLVNQKGYSSFPSLGVTESTLSHQGFHMLLGRDVLAGCLLLYDGVSGTFTISF